MKPGIRTLLTRPSYLLAAGFGAGLSPLAPGTVGSALALALFLPALLLPLWMQLAIIALAFAIGVPLCGRLAKDLQQKDPGVIVWDEFVGMWLALLPLNALESPLAWQSWPWLLAAFLVFRLLDIIKPWPANWADQRLPGGAGVMLDDAVAGGYTLAILMALHQLL